VPPAHVLPDRTAGVLGLLDPLFNEGYSASASPTRHGPPDLTADTPCRAMGLTKIVSGY